ncbi:MAG: efflux RND transporter periplasmic adaptor subunit [Deltaproteobacteria bacterium]|nr:efflux RND transporter periplasmic adaptor subunit [Deltaproteobacteria bacterium]
MLLALAALAVLLDLRHRDEPTVVADEPAAHRAPVLADEHAAHQGTNSTRPEGFAPVALDPAQATAMGLTTEVVSEREFSRKVRTVGLVTVDETRTAHVHSRVRGWIEGYYVQFVGRKVKKGEALVSLYSQEVYAAQLELASLIKSPLKSPELLDAARNRLALWNVPRSVIDHIERTGEPKRTIPVVSPRAGVVVAKQAFEGMFVDPSIELYTISDLTRVWILADIYEADVSSVRAGSSASLTVEGVGEPISAKVAFLYPTIDERTRTRKARFELANVSAAVMPGAFVTVELELAEQRGLAVPESAVIRTGARSIVFIVHGTHAEPREVKLTGRVGDYYRVESGVVAGEHVATGAQFLLDSESRLRASSAPGGGHAGH